MFSSIGKFCLLDIFRCEQIALWIAACETGQFGYFAMRAETLFLFLFWGTVGVPINYDKTTECYKTCAFYFPTEWIPYCLTVMDAFTEDLLIYF